MWPLAAFGVQGAGGQDQLTEFGTGRGVALRDLSGQGIDPNRMVIGTLDSKFPNSVDEAELTQDRIVRFTLLTVGGR